MTSESEAAADVLTGAVVANSVDTEVRAGSTPHVRREPPAACLNCGAARLGAYCSECGQSGHIHRSFASLGHDLLHSVFHFEGKFWRTMPELIFHPGRLTRRYINGERAKFISPMALFLFTVFLMYAVFAFVPGDERGESLVTFADSEELRLALDGPDAGSAGDASVASQPAGPARLSSPVQRPAQRSDTEPPVRPSDRVQPRAQPPVQTPDTTQSPVQPSDTTQPPSRSAEAAQQPAPDGAAESDGLIRRAITKFREDPALVAYKVKSNGYKFSWLLVPLSIPFVWMLFFWRREFRLYDHAVFVTYSISFMTLLLVVSTLADLAGAGKAVQVALTMVVPPLHIYTQLRGAYGLSRVGALVRLFFVLIAAGTVISVFVSMLFLMGALE